LACPVVCRILLLLSCGKRQEESLAMDYSPDSSRFWHTPISWRDSCNRSVLSLLAANFLVIIWAVLERWSLGVLVWVYWGQSVIMGFFWLWRTMHYELQQLRRETGSQERKRSMAPGGSDWLFESLPMYAGRRNPVGTAVFFLLHYSAVHFVLAKWLVHMSRFWDVLAVKRLPIRVFVLFGAVFIVEQYISLRRDLKANPGRRMNVGKSARLLYGHIVPIHVTIFIGTGMQESLVGEQMLVPIFLIVKTGIDVLMHVVRKKGYEYEDPPIEQGGGFKITRAAGRDQLQLADGQVIDLADHPDLAERIDGIRALPPEVQQDVLYGLLRKEQAGGEIRAAPACVCDVRDLIEGTEAHSYAEGHLQLLRTDTIGLQSEYVCPSTGKKWILVFTGAPGDDPTEHCRLRSVPPTNR
jgi:hypothetical protein